MTMYHFHVTDKSTTLPLQGVQCGIHERPDGTGDGNGGITDANGNADVEALYFYVASYSLYKAGYDPVLKSPVPLNITVALNPTGIIFYWAHIHPGVGGSTIPSGSAQYSPNTQLQVTAYPDEGYEFDRWLVDNVDKGSRNPETFIVDHDGMTIAAVFKEARYTVTITAGIGGSVMPSGTFEAEPNLGITILAVASPGYVLDYWLVNGELGWGNDNPITPAITKDNFTIKAIFKPTGGGGAAVYTIENMTTGKSVSVETNAQVGTLDIRLGDKIKAYVANYPPSTEVKFQVGGPDWIDLFAGTTDSKGTLAAPVAEVTEFIAAILSTRAIAMPSGPAAYINLHAVELALKPLATGVILSSVGSGLIFGLAIASSRRK